VTLRHATILVLSLAVAAVACIDLSAPKGPASISLIKLPAAFVVRGDVMRDSAGTPAPPVINQFDANGRLIGGAAPQFFILDSAPAAHFDPSNSVLVGDKLGIVNFIGQVGSLQTPSIQVPVTVLPVKIDQGTGNAVSARSFDGTITFAGYGVAVLTDAVAGCDVGSASEWT